MSYQHLQSFIDRLDRAGELVHIRRPVSAHLEISAISDRVMKQPGGGSALLFHNVTGYDVPLAINLFGSRKRMAWALGVDELDEIGRDIKSLIKLPGNMPRSFGEMLSMAPHLLPLASIGPKTVSKGMSQEVVKIGKDANLDFLPIITCWPDDGGPYITLPLVFTKEAAT
jgi:4-hydroxy-3-polyprenylbenzoate decarboxylase